VLAALITSSFEAAYFPCCFKTAKVTVLPKSNKTTAQKSTPGAWKSISLLNLLGKVVEAAFARRVTDAAKAEHLLPNGQMGNKRNNSINLVIRMIVEAATKARKREGIALLLQLDIKEAFNAIYYR
jgi:formiminotetrahydrofolate cyclodeaminase